MNKYIIIGAILVIIFLALCVKLLNRVQYYQKVGTASTNSAPINSVQVISDSLNNEVDDNGDPTTNYKKYIDITEADFSYTNSAYNLVLKTADDFPKTLASNEEINIEFDLRNKLAPSTNEIIVFGNSDANGNYLFTASAGGKTYSVSPNADNFLPGDYSVEGNTVHISIPKDFIDNIELSLPSNSLEWQAQTQYELPSDTSQNIQLSANNFVPNNKGNWITYR